MLCSWLHPSLAIRPSPLHGRGTFATAPIGADEVVTVWAHRVLTREEVVHAPPGTRLRRAWSGRGDTWLLQPPDDRAAPEHFLNHACDANVWMGDEVTLVARRLVAAGEELTADYALWELDPDWVSPFRCRCGSAECRGVITGRDWEDSKLQRRYAAHFHPVLNARIGAQSASPGE